MISILLLIPAACALAWVWLEVREEMQRNAATRRQRERQPDEN